MTPFDLFLCVFGAVIVIVTAQTESGTKSVATPVDANCLNCLCEAASGCNTTLRCENRLCGPYQITRDYWLDAHKPVKKGQLANSPSAYADCANDLECSKRAVTAYMKRYAKDCNGDGDVNCIDYASIHRLGPGGCDSALDQRYYYKFANCFQKVFQPGSGIGGPRTNIGARNGLFDSPQRDEDKA